MLSIIFYFIDCWALWPWQISVLLYFFLLIFGYLGIGSYCLLQLFHNFIHSIIMLWWKILFHFINIFYFADSFIFCFIFFKSLDVVCNRLYHSIETASGFQPMAMEKEDQRHLQFIRIIQKFSCVSLLSFFHNKSSLCYLEKIDPKLYLKYILFLVLTISATEY